MDITNFEGKDQFIETLISRFGTITKNDLEVELFHFMCMNNLKNKTAYEISAELKIPLAKVKRLMYESDLKYPKTNDDYKNIIFDVLKNANFKRQENSIVFAIPDKMARQYFDSLLYKNNSFRDSSFVSDIVSISYFDLLIIINELDGSKEQEWNDCLSNIKQKIEYNEQNIGETELAKITKVSSNILKLVPGINSNLCDFVSDKIKDLMIKNKMDKEIKKNTKQ